jgi:flagellar biosynthesis component FlhA
MNLKKFNWQVWAGFLLAIASVLSYPFFFVNFPVTRDFPWANLLLFGIAAVLLVLGVRRAFAPGRSRKSKIGGSILVALGLLIIGMFIFTAFIAARWLPASLGAPHVGQVAPDFTLSDTTGKSVSLAQLLAEPINGTSAKPKGVLLIFYRGYW